MQIFKKQGKRSHSLAEIMGKTGELAVSDTPQDLVNSIDNAEFSNKNTISRLQTLEGTAQDVDNFSSMEDKDKDGSINKKG